MDEEIREAINSSLTMAQAADSLNIPFTTFKRKAKELGLYNPNRGGKGISKKPNGKQVSLGEILEGKHPKYQRGHLKRRLLDNGIFENVCDNCGLTEWNGKDINCHLDHINGINNDHRRENLRMLCPNCHSQTPTYCGRNIKN